MIIVPNCYYISYLLNWYILLSWNQFKLIDNQPSKDRIRNKKNNFLFSGSEDGCRFLPFTDVNFKIFLALYSWKIKIFVLPKITVKFRCALYSYAHYTRYNMVINKLINKTKQHGTFLFYLHGLLSHECFLIKKKIMNKKYAPNMIQLIFHFKHKQHWQPIDLASVKSGFITPPLIVKFVNKTEHQSVFLTYLCGL